MSLETDGYECDMIYYIVEGCAGSPPEEDTTASWQQQIGILAIFFGVCLITYSLVKLRGRHKI